MEKSTISTFLKNKDMIKAADVSKDVVNKQRPQITNKFEKLMLKFIKGKDITDDRISVGIICKKALESQNESPKGNTRHCCINPLYTVSYGKYWFRLRTNR